MKPFESVQVIGDLLPGQCTASPIVATYVRRPMDRFDTQQPGPSASAIHCLQRQGQRMVAHLDNGGCVPLDGPHAWSIVL